MEYYFKTYKLSSGIFMEKGGSMTWGGRQMVIHFSQRLIHFSPSLDAFRNYNTQNVFGETNTFRFALEELKNKT